MILLLKSLQLFFRIIFYAPVNVSLSIMHGAGWLVQTVAKKTRLKKIVVGNIKMVLPQSQAGPIADKLIENIAHAILELLCIPFFRPEHFDQVISWQGEQRLEAALKQGKGVIILTMHAGGYELIPMALAKRGYKINTVFRATAEDSIFEIVNQSRQQGGVNLINILEEDMYKQTLKALADNELVFLLADTGALESRHEYISFLGKKVPAATGWLTLAQRSGAVVIPTLAKKAGPKNTIIMFQPIEVTKDNREAIIQETGQIFESYIEHNPEQWAIFINEFETRRMTGNE